MAYYTAGKPFSLAQWNALISDVNAILENPPEGCDPVSPIPLVVAPHLWAVSDVETVRAKLIETCPDIVFHEELELWTKSLLDEIEFAMSQTWCDCESEEEVYVETTFGPVQFTWTEIQAAYDPVKNGGYLEYFGTPYLCVDEDHYGEHRYFGTFYPCQDRTATLASMAANYTLAGTNSSAYRTTVDDLLVLAKDIREVQPQIDADVAEVDALIAEYASCSGGSCATIAAAICAKGIQARTKQDTLDTSMSEFLTKYPDMAIQRDAADVAAAANWSAALALQARFPTGVNMLTYGASFYTYPWAEWFRPDYDDSITPLVPTASITRLIYDSGTGAITNTYTRSIYVSPSGIPYVASSGIENFLVSLVRPYVYRPTRYLCDRLGGTCSDGTKACEWGPWRYEQAYRPWSQSCSIGGTLGHLWVPIMAFEDVQDTLDPYGVRGKIRYAGWRNGHDYTDEQNEYWTTTVNWYTEHPQYDDRHAGYC